jgi:hypothetical protein
MLLARRLKRLPLGGRSYQEDGKERGAQIKQHHKFDY